MAADAAARAKAASKVGKEEKVKKAIGNGIRIVLFFKDAVSQALQLVPQAALAWAGVSFALQVSSLLYILLDPV